MALTPEAAAAKAVLTPARRVNGNNGKRRRKEKREPLTPLLVRDGLYFSADIMDVLGLQDTTLADWKRGGVNAAPTPAGDVVCGGDLMDFLLARAKYRGDRGDEAEPNASKPGETT